LSDLLVAYGLDDRVATLYSHESSLLTGLVSEERTDDPDARLALGRVVRVERTRCLAATAAGLCLVEPDGVISRRAGLAAPPVSGDWVVLAAQPGSDPAVVGILPRRSELSRRAPGDRADPRQVLVANIDVLAIAVPLDRPFSASRVERTLVLAWESRALPLLVLTKADLAEDVEQVATAAETIALGVDVIVTSGVTGVGADELLTIVAGGTLAFIGPSGSGKSTLVNTIVGSEVQRTGDVRWLDSRGRHTTTSRDLVPIPGGGVLLDTPGLRGLGLLDAEAGMATTFADIEELASQCRFSDCGHASEPGCAVAAAIGAGDLDRRRLDNYQKMVRELAHEKRRAGQASYAERRQLRARFIAMHREAGPTRLDERRQSRG
jgi:ribosome biogenesis GTPase / thiamine phosphate phosphatase